MKSTLCAALAVLLLLPTAATAAAAPEPAGADTMRWLRGHGDVRVQEMAARVQELAGSFGSSRYGGARWTEDGQLVVQVVGADQAAPQAGIRFERVRHARRALDGVVAEAPALVEHLVGPGKLESAYVNVTANKAVVSVLADSTATVAAALGARYGDAVEVVAASKLQPRTVANRQDDNSPYYGGLAINNAASQPGTEYGCTSGYAFKLWSTGQIVESTAGHCWARGTAVYNATAAIGTVTHRAFASNGPTDAELITPPSSATFGARIWVGGRFTDVSWPVVGAIDENDAYIGSPIVLSGKNGGETRGTVTAVNVTHCYPDGCTKGLTAIKVTSGGVAPGDSGGPCFSSGKDQPYTAMARGEIVGPAADVGQTTYCTSVFDISAALGASVLLY
ncbi:hypothetical protein [Amycolatopsis benzoatilytica]|uniref:hypothetical protein n=1 Tax=Amycolatopsis benzoatilytica TaxID=346045 RepID=UPI00039DD6EA|nr:hypothetical protein [Amycolatopsis benzoatilytica]